MSEHVARGGRRVISAATPETATGGHRSSRKHYNHSAGQSKAHLFRGFLVMAPEKAIIGLRHERGSDLWEVDTPAGTLPCSSKGLIRFKRFRNRCAYRLGLSFSSSPTQAQWLDILHRAVCTLLEGRR
jgi:hypothetical protein